MTRARRLIFISNGGAFVAKPLACAMQYLDPQLLKSDLIESLFYLHSQPPLFNLFLGIVSKLSEISSLSYQLFFNTAGAVITLSFYGILIYLGINWIISLFITIVFMLNPTLILYEHLLYYSYFEVLFISLSLFFLVRWCRNKKAGDVLLFWTFLLCLGMIRSVFHPVFILATSVGLTFYLWFWIKEQRCAKIFLLASLVALAPLSVGECLAQPIDNTKINKQDTSQKELTVDQQVETKQDRKIRPVQGLRILEPNENPARTVIKAKNLTRKEPAPIEATDK